MDRRGFLRTAGTAASLIAMSKTPFSGSSVAAESSAASDSLPLQLYKSMSDEQRSKVCLPVDHASRAYVSNWWYVHPQHRIPATFNDEQRELIQTIFDGLHSPDHQDAVNDQVAFDQYGNDRNAPAVGFFGTPDDAGFEFIYTGHHVTRRCNAHTDDGLGFGGNPIFYGHFREQFNETKDHPGNPYWYQGKIFNEFVGLLSEEQKQTGLVSGKPRSEKSAAVLKKRANGHGGLDCADLSREQQQQLVKTMRGMLAMFRADDVEATVRAVEERDMIRDLHISWYDGKYDVGGDQVWDTWQIEGPEMVWYFRGQPHIHCYFHLQNANA